MEDDILVQCPFNEIKLQQNRIPRGASQVNLHSEIIKPLWVYNTSLGLMNTPRVDTKISRVQGGHRRG